MKKILIFAVFFLILNCSFNKVIQNHGVHNLEKKQAKLKVNQSNKNDVLKIVGQPHSKSINDDNEWFYVERSFKIRF